MLVRWQLMGALEDLEARIEKIEGTLRVFYDPACELCGDGARANRPGRVVDFSYLRGTVFDGERRVLCDCVQGGLLKLKGDE